MSIVFKSSTGSFFFDLFTTIYLLIVLLLLLLLLIFVYLLYTCAQNVDCVRLILFNRYQSYTSSLTLSPPSLLTKLTGATHNQTKTKQKGPRSKFGMLMLDHPEQQCFKQ